MKLLVTLILSLSFSLTVPAKNNAPLELSVSADSLSNRSTERWTYNFGSVLINTSRFADFYLKNIGSTPLKIRGIYLSGGAFWAQSNCPEFLQPNHRCITRVEFRPWSEGSFYGRLRYVLVNKVIYIDLYGWGVRY